MSHRMKILLIFLVIQVMWSLLLIVRKEDTGKKQSDPLTPLAQDVTTGILVSTQRYQTLETNFKRLLWTLITESWKLVQSPIKKLGPQTTGTKNSLHVIKVIFFHARYVSHLLHPGLVYPPGDGAREARPFAVTLASTNETRSKSPAGAKDWHVQSSLRTQRNTLCQNRWQKS